LFLTTVIEADRIKPEKRISTDFAKLNVGFVEVNLCKLTWEDLWLQSQNGKDVFIEKK
jgi:hypothetical protein